MSAKEIIAFTRIEGEKRRVYTFPVGTVAVNRVVALSVRPSGSHRLETEDGRKFIIPSGWMCLEIVAGDWSV